MQGCFSRNMLNKKIEEAKFICLDTETTGLDPLHGGRICEVAMLGSRGGERAGSYATLLNPQVVISPEVTAIHGITNEMVASAPSFADIAFNLIDFLTIFSFLLIRDFSNFAHKFGHFAFFASVGNS